MDELTLESLAKRVEALEKLVAANQRKKDWRSGVGMSEDNEFTRSMLAEIEAKGGGWVIWDRAVATTRSLGTLARSVLKERRHHLQGRTSDRTGPARGASAGASSA